jgi:DNA-binding response OmpR family regulator
MHRALSGLVILLVDDDPDTRREYALALARAGSAVRSTSCAEDAEPILAHELVHVVVCDEHVDARAVVRSLRALPDLERRLAPAIGLGEGHDIRERVGLDAVLPKPVRPVDLVACVDRIAARAARRGSATAATLKLPRVG